MAYLTERGVCIHVAWTIHPADIPSRCEVDFTLLLCVPSAPCRDMGCGKLLNEPLIATLICCFDSNLVIHFSVAGTNSLASLPTCGFIVCVQDHGSV